MKSPEKFGVEETRGTHGKKVQVQLRGRWGRIERQGDTERAGHTPYKSVGLLRTNKPLTVNKGPTCSPLVLRGRLALSALREYEKKHLLPFGL